MVLSVKCKVCDWNGYEFGYTLKDVKKEAQKLGIEIEFDNQNNLLFVCPDCK